MSNITAEEITKIIYQNSNDNTEGLIIKFENIQDVLVKLENAMQEHTKQNIEALRSDMEEKMKDEYYNIYAIDKLFNQFLQNIK